MCGKEGRGSAPDTHISFICLSASLQTVSSFSLIFLPSHSSSFVSESHRSHSASCRHLPVTCLAHLSLIPWFPYGTTIHGSEAPTSFPIPSSVSTSCDAGVDENYFLQVTLKSAAKQKNKAPIMSPWRGGQFSSLLNVSKLAKKRPVKNFPTARKGSISLCTTETLVLKIRTQSL